MLDRANRGDEPPVFESRGTDLWPDADFEIRTTGDGLTLEGYAAVFDLPSVPMPGPAGKFTETIRAGAFTNTLASNPDVTLRYQHNLLTLPLGRTRAGTLTLAEDSRGLHVEARLPDNEIGRPVRDAIARGDISGMSFSFRAVLDKWSTDRSTRDLLEVRMGPEVSVVDFPAYPDTSVLVRALQAPEVELDDLTVAINAVVAGERISREQRDLLMGAISKLVDEPFVGPKLAAARERLAALA